MVRYINAMPRARKAIYDEVAAASKQIDKHIIRLLLYPDAREHNHWKQETVGFLEDVDLLKGTNKWPSEKLLLSALRTHNDILDTYRWQVEKTERDLTPLNVSPSVIQRAVEAYQDWLAIELSANGAIDRYSAYEVLDEIVNEAMC